MVKSIKVLSTLFEIFKGNRYRANTIILLSVLHEFKNEPCSITNRRLSEYTGIPVKTVESTIRRLKNEKIQEANGNNVPLISSKFNKSHRRIITFANINDSQYYLLPLIVQYDFKLNNASKLLYSVLYTIQQRQKNKTKSRYITISELELARMMHYSTRTIRYLKDDLYQHGYFKNLIIEKGVGLKILLTPLKEINTYEFRKSYVNASKKIVLNLAELSEGTSKSTQGIVLELAELSEGTSKSTQGIVLELAELSEGISKNTAGLDKRNLKDTANIPQKNSSTSIPNKKETPEAYLTSRLDVYLLPFKSLIEVNLDWISITGKFHAELYGSILQDNNWHRVLRKDIDGHPTMFILSRLAKSGKKEKIATLSRDKYHNNNWTIGTSNHFRDVREKERVLNVIRLFEVGTVHCTRTDIAFDFKNYNNLDKYGLFTKNMSQTLYSDRAGRLETDYRGARSSNIQYRLYDKLKEQTKKKKAVPATIKNWIRLELQLRDDKTSSWYEQAIRMLNSFKRVNLTDILDKLGARTFFVVAGILQHPQYFNKEYLSEKTLSKYRKLFEENRGFDTALAEQAKKALDDNRDAIQKEINSFLVASSNSLILS